MFDIVSVRVGAEVTVQAPTTGVDSLTQLIEWARKRGWDRSRYHNGFAKIRVTFTRFFANAETRNSEVELLADKVKEFKSQILQAELSLDPIEGLIK